MVNNFELTKFLILSRFRTQFSRTKLGFSWLFINCFLHIIIIGVIYGYVFSPDDMLGHLKYFSISYTVWYVMSSMLSEACLIWPSNEKYIKHIPTDLSVFLYSHVGRFFLILIINLPTAIFINFYFGGISLLDCVFSLFGALVFMYFSFVISIILSFTNLKVRDVSRFMPNLLLLIYLASPILWRAEVLGENRWVADINPVYHLIEIVRYPMLDGGFPISSYISLLPYFFVLSISAYIIYQKNKKDIPFYV